ncbi:lipoprotein [Streptomyces clavuligerus]|nr:lipoprotein [Streptomyces clavuligerus]
MAGGALLLAGCGIRTTQVPVDAGPAPSRLPCTVTDGPDGGPGAGDGLPVRVELLCAAKLKQVDRTVELPADGLHDEQLRMATALLDELRRKPTADERGAGFGTDVPAGLTVAGGARAGDPVGTLRLSLRPERLPGAALAQIVCTFAESRAAAAGGAVILGGPDESGPRGYTCPQRLTERPAEPVPTLSSLPAPAAPVYPGAATTF